MHAFRLQTASSLAVVLLGVVPMVGDACLGQGLSQTAASEPDGGRLHEWSQLKGNSGFTGLSSDDSVKPPLKLVWSYRLDGDASGDAGAGVIVAGGKVFASVANSHSIVALDAENGRFCWEHRDQSIGSAGYIGHTTVPSYDNCRVILWQRRNSSGVMALDARTGAVVWKQSLSPKGKDVSRGGLPVADGLVYCSEGGPEPAVGALDTATNGTSLSSRHRHRAVGPLSDGTSPQFISWRSTRAARLRRLSVRLQSREAMIPLAIVTLSTRQKQRKPQLALMTL